MEEVRANNFVQVTTLKPDKGTSYAWVLDTDDKRAYIVYITGQAHFKYNIEPIWIDKKYLKRL